MERIDVLCAMRDERVVGCLRRKMDDRYTFRFAKNGEAALRSAAQCTPDVLVIDAVLPGLDGMGVIDRLRGMLGARMPEVIGGSVLSFADDAFARRGVQCCMSVPWKVTQLETLIEQLSEKRAERPDWEKLRALYVRAGERLRQMGMNEGLRGFSYLAWAAALVCEREERLRSIGEKLYTPIAEYAHTSPQSVERLIRHAVERTVDTVGEREIYTFFGNTIDPMRGKPTNAQMIALLAQRLRTAQETA